MACIGIVGGLGPEGTVHYYRKLAKHLAEIPLDEGRPGIVFDHVRIESFASLLRSGAEREVASLLTGSVGRLHRAGAEIAMIAAVTPHKFLASVRRDSPVPLVDLVEATEREVTAVGYRAVGLLGTRLTLTDSFFRGGLERAGIRVVVPGEGGISYLNNLIFGPLAFRGEDTRDEARRAGDRPQDDGGVEAGRDRSGVHGSDGPPRHGRASRRSDRLSRASCGRGGAVERGRVRRRSSTGGAGSCAGDRARFGATCCTRREVAQARESGDRERRRAA